MRAMPSYTKAAKLHVLHMELLIQGEASDFFVCLIHDADLEGQEIS
jgi:hypothetical protein